MSSGKPKAFLKQAKGKKRKEQILDDADDYLAAAVEHEDAVGKHRGGDPMKSLRFARRALELYSQGLAKYPKNFDLAYNKARLELEIATHPSLVKHLDVSVNEILRQALSSHQYALGLDPQNADLLFNASQVLTTIAEQIAKDDGVSDAEALQYLEQALEYQGRCLEIQELKWTESRKQHEQALQQGQDEEEDDGGAKLDAGTTSAFEDNGEDEQWVSIVEPVTADTLIDTVLAQLGTLTTLCSIINTSISSPQTSSNSVVNPVWIESYSTKIVNGVLPNILNTSKTETQSRAGEIELVKAIFSSALLELAYRSHSIDIQVYKQCIKTAFASRELDGDASALVAHSRALVALNSAMADVPITVSSSASADLYTHANLRWISLSEGQTLLATASKLSTNEASSVAMTHALRGDISLLLRALSDPPLSHPQALSNRSQLAKNAEVFYRNATKLFASLGADGEDDKATYQFRESVVRVLLSLETFGTGDPPSGTPAAAATQTESSIHSILRDASKDQDDAWKKEHLEEMVDEGLVNGNIFGIS